jgi:hypothetical protein
MKTDTLEYINGFKNGQHFAALQCLRIVGKDNPGLTTAIQEFFELEDSDVGYIQQ